MSAPAPPPLQVTVVTADIKGAGTDGSVTITIEGEKGSAKDLALSNDYLANFERGHTDVFDVTAPDVGVIKSVTVKLVSGCPCLEPAGLAHTTLAHLCQPMSHTCCLTETRGHSLIFLHS
jgi:hypothetical protein